MPIAPPRSTADLLLRLLSVSRQPSAVGPRPLTPDPRPPTPAWAEIANMAACHGLAPLLFKRLKASDAGANVPADAWERLRLAYFVNAARNNRIFRELGPVFRCLRGSGIPVIALKGAFLAEAVYGDVALRPMSDVDLMVPKAELPRAQAVLLDMGGIQEQSEDIELSMRNHQLPPFVVGDLDVDIHWNITPPTGPVKIDIAGLWARAHPATIAGVEVLALSPEDLLLHLCLHSSYHHRLDELRFLYDIAETIRHYRNEIDWQQVARTAGEWRASRYVGLTLHLARCMSGAGVPDDVLEQLVPGGIDRHMLHAASESVLARTGYGRWMPFFDMARAKSFRDKADLSKLFRKRVFLSREQMAVKYPASRESKYLYLYYVLRLRDAVRALWAYIQRRSLPMMRSRAQNRNISLVNWLTEDRRPRPKD